jgi:hypothetical protein
MKSTWCRSAQILAETAFLDRFAGIIPGWKIPKFQREMMASQVGLKMDFFGEALLTLRRDNRFFSYAQRHIKFDRNTTVRDQNAISKQPQDSQDSVPTSRANSDGLPKRLFRSSPQAASGNSWFALLSRR